MKRKLLWPRYDLDQWGWDNTWHWVEHARPSDTQEQFARLFGRKMPKRKRKGNRE